MAHRRRSRRNSKHMISDSLSKGVNFATSTTKKVGSTVVNTGSKVIKKGTDTVPYLQRLTRKFFGMFGMKKTARRRHRR